MSGRWLVLGIGLLALARVVVAARTPVIDDEAYYWIWPRHLTLSYLDHPPLVAWLDALTTAAGRTEWQLRLPANVATLPTAALRYLLRRVAFHRQARRPAPA